METIEQPCLTCLLYKTLSASRVFAFQLFLPCVRHHEEGNNTLKYNQFNRVFYAIYVNIVETFLWMTSGYFIWNIIFDDGICNNWSLIVKENQIIIEIIIFLLSLYLSLQFSFFRRKKIHILQINVRDVKEHNIFKKMDSFLFFMLKNLIMILLILNILLSLYILPLYNQEKYAFLKNFCFYVQYLWLLFNTSHLFIAFSYFIVLIFLIYYRLIDLSDKLFRMKRNTTISSLERFIREYIKIWEYIQHMNHQWEEFFPLIYAYSVYITCFLIYLALFVPMDDGLKNGILIVALCYLTSALFAALGLSRLSSSVYDNFIGIGRFSFSQFSIEERLKILDFMKSFGKMPIGFSIGGFFFVKKKFFIKMVSGLYSVFSTLLELRGSRRPISHVCYKNHVNITGSI